MLQRLLLLSLILVSLSCGFKINAKQIALTFDDAPRPDTNYFKSKARNQLLLQHLSQHKVTAMFFVTTKHIAEGREARIQDYKKHGQLLANHTHSHPSASKIPVAEFMSDVLQAHNILKKYTHYQPYFRFPYLRHGDTKAKLRALRANLTNLGLNQGYVTVDNYDWYLDSQLQLATQAKMDIPLDKWREVYLTHLLASVDFNHTLATKYLGKPVKQVLLLHENDLAALFVGDLITTLEQQGWEIISPIDAYQDPIAQHLPDTLYNGQGRIAALAAEKGIDLKNLRRSQQNEQSMKQELLELGLVP